jgi:hypothetical protein
MMGTLYRRLEIASTLLAQADRSRHPWDREHRQLLNIYRGVIGSPISGSFTTYCVCLELRFLPSTGVTGFRGRPPGLSLTGSALIVSELR